MRPLLATGAFALALAVPALASTPPAQKNLGCGTGKVVVSVKYQVLNDVDTGMKANNWAFDDYVRTLRVVHKSGNRYCAGSTYSGTFTSIAGPSPAGATTIPAGIRGTFKGASVTTFRATFAPGLEPTRGELATKDFQCTSADTKGDCPGTFDWLSTYFSSTDNFAGFKYVSYMFVYHATEGGHGTWTDRLAGGKIRTSGDITALKRH